MLDILHHQMCLGSDMAQSKQILQAMNTARSIQTLAQQASAYVTASTFPSSLPRYVNMNPVNDWTSSALMATAMETVTLPSRLRDLGGRQASLSLLVDILNRDGRQNIFELSASVLSSVQGNGSSTEVTSGCSNEHTNQSRTRSSQTNLESNSMHGTLELDIQYATKLSETSRETDAHIFSQAVVQRGLTGNNEATHPTGHIMSRMPSTDTVVEK
jgi:hypothetical protein